MPGISQGRQLEPLIRRVAIVDGDHKPTIWMDETPAVNLRASGNWSEIIQDAKRRLSYFRDGLDHDPSLPNVLDYLARQHADVVPQGLLPDHQGPEPDASDTAKDK